MTETDTTLKQLCVIRVVAILDFILLFPLVIAAITEGEGVVDILGPIHSFEMLGAISGARGRVDGGWSRQRANGFGGPVTVVWAAEDRVMPRSEGETLAAGFPRSRLVIVEDSYVLVPLDQPERLAELIREHMDWADTAAKIVVEELF